MWLGHHICHPSCLHASRAVYLDQQTSHVCTSTINRVPARCPITSEPSSSSSATASNKLHPHYTGGIPNNTGGFFPRALVPSHIRNSRGSATASAVPRVFTPHVPFILINKHLTCTHQPSTGSPHIAQSHPNPRRHRLRRRATNCLFFGLNK